MAAFAPGLTLVLYWLDAWALTCRLGERAAAGAPDRTGSDLIGAWPEAPSQYCPPVQPGSATTYSCKEMA